MRKTTKISVCNYDTYQNEQQAGNKQVTNSQQTGNKQVTTREERKEGKEGKEGKEALYPFDDWWCAYGKKVNRKKAEAKWGRLKEVEKEKCMDVVKAYVQSTPEVKYRKDPITYLNNESWNDDLATTQEEETSAQIMDSGDALKIIKHVKSGMGWV